MLAALKQRTPNAPDEDEDMEVKPMTDLPVDTVRLRHGGLLCGSNLFRSCHTHRILLNQFWKLLANVPELLSATW